MNKTRRALWSSANTFAAQTRSEFTLRTVASLSTGHKKIVDSKNEIRSAVKEAGESLTAVQRRIKLIQHA
ncbi:hypothetical protein EMIT0194MI4_50400 [Pseudomonas sp. IT-194MI4]|jgi:hypothetical protein